MEKEKIKMSEYFWAKTTQDGNPGKSVPAHLRDVQAVANILLDNRKSLLSRYGLSREIVAAFAGLHDIGKISPGFQAKCREWLQQNNLKKVAINNAWDTLEADHAKVTQYTIQNILRKKNMTTEASEIWGALLGSHHGRLNRLGVTPKGCKPDDEWENKRESIASDFLCSIPLPDFPIDTSWPLVWWLAGLVSVADWIASNEDYFPPDKIETKPEESLETASAAVKAIGFNDINIQQGLSFGDIFRDNYGQPFLPNDLQVKTGESICKPGIYIVEAPMGAGKTEAALWSAYKLMCTGKASGIYFALPTQTTSNRMHTRMKEFLDNISLNPIQARLVHANSWLLDNIDVPHIRPAVVSESESAWEAKDWFASKKRALLAPVGVGTVDQALMSVIAVKHFFVRQFALAGKVIILDEVHSYDLYTGTLIKTLCDRLLPLGCTIMILSATLTGATKKRFINIVDSDNDDKVCSLITGKGQDDDRPSCISVKKPEEKDVCIAFGNEADVLLEAVKKAEKGASVLWICNTVGRAQEMYKSAQEKLKSRIEIGLLHARFPLFRREELESYWMTKLGKEGKGRSGCILFSTQVVEQSVDLDADFMVSELAPTDMLLQRMGRLWRHKRGRRPCEQPGFCIVAEHYPFEKFKKCKADNIKKMFGAKAKVYAPYVLLRSFELWKDKKIVKLPDDIRDLIKETYKERSGEPEGWQKLFEKIKGGEFAQEMLAKFEANVWNVLLSDEEGLAKTRINNYPMTQMILAKQKKGVKLTLLNGEVTELGNDAVTLNSARAIHRNIVKVPEYCFLAQAENKSISALVHGSWQLGFVEEDGNIANQKFKSGYASKYTPKEGVEIMRDKTKSGVDDEPCD